MSTTTGRDESWDVIARRLGESESVTDRLNGEMVRSVIPSLVAQLRVGTSKQRVLFVPREKLREEKSYVLTSFIGNDTYEFILVDAGAVQRADRCSSAIRVEVLTGFLRDLIIIANPPAEPEPVAVAETEPAPPVVEAPRAPIDGWIRPSADELLQTRNLA
jgi:hypothetical protein